MNSWLIVLVGGLITFLMRLSFIHLLVGLEVPEGVRRALRFVPSAVLSAIILPELIMPSGSIDLSLGNDRLLAGLLAVLVAWRTKSTLLTLLAGIAALLILRLAV